MTLIWKPNGPSSCHCCILYVGKLRPDAGDSVRALFPKSVSASSSTLEAKGYAPVFHEIFLALGLLIIKCDCLETMGGGFVLRWGIIRLFFL